MPPKAEGLSSGQLSQIREPWLGLDILARDPVEIALSILSEITRSARSTTVPIETADVPRSLTAPASIDPICGMEVEATSPLHTAYQGVEYRFCSESCL